MRVYGSAVFAALRARNASIDELGCMIRKGRTEAFSRGGNDDAWLDCFWHTMAILRANKSENNMARAEGDKQ